TCGSCWAFSAATALSDRFRIAEPDNESMHTKFTYTPYIYPNETYIIKNQLSPYELVTCDICELTGSLLSDSNGKNVNKNGKCDMGCEGGYLQHVYKYLELYGVSTMECAPPTCDPTKPNVECDCVR